MMRICGTIYAWTDAWDFKTWYNWSTIVHWNWSTKRQLFIRLFFISDSQYSPLPKKVTQSSSKLISALLTSRSDLFFWKLRFCVWFLWSYFNLLAKDGDHIFYLQRVCDYSSKIFQLCRQKMGKKYFIESVL